MLRMEHERAADLMGRTFAAMRAYRNGELERGARLHAFSITVEDRLKKAAFKALRTRRARVVGITYYHVSWQRILRQAFNSMLHMHITL